MAYKEIVTKAVIGKGKKYFKNNYVVKVDVKPTTVLGCWVINHKFKGYKTKDKIGVDGEYDVNIWYSYDNDSKTTVVNKKIEYNDLFNLKVKDDSSDLNDTEIIVRTLSQPNCVKVDIDDSNIVFDIEKELGVEIVGEKKIKIEVNEEEEKWDILEDDMDEVLDEIDKKVDENYIKEDK